MHNACKPVRVINCIISVPLLPGLVALGHVPEKLLKVPRYIS